MSTRRPRWPILLAFTVLLFAMLACGGFQVRVTPVPKATEAPTAEPTEAPTATQAPTATPTTAPATSTPTASPAAGGLTAGSKARIIAAGGVNVRDQASAKGKLVGRLNVNAAVTVLEGPVQAESYDWWRVDNGAGLSGWVAAGSAADPWLVPAATAGSAAPNPTPGTKLVDRAIKVGDRVQVTTDPAQVLTVRDYAGTGATALAKVLKGTIFTVRGGPVRMDGLVWWELEGENLKGWAAEGSGQDRWLTPVE